MQSKHRLLANISLHAIEIKKIVPTANRIIDWLTTLLVYNYLTPDLTPDLPANCCCLASWCHQLAHKLTLLLLEWLCYYNTLAQNINIMKETHARGSPSQRQNISRRPPRFKQ